MNFRTFQLLGDVFINGQFKGREEVIVILPEGFEVSSFRAHQVFNALLVTGGGRNVTFSLLADTAKTPAKTPAKETIFPIHIKPRANPDADAEYVGKAAAIIPLPGLPNESGMGFTEGAPGQGSW